MIDNLTFSYPGHVEDLEKGMILLQSGDKLRLERLMKKCQKRQQIHEGDRSHPQLVALDALELTYPGWESDYNDVKMAHYEFDGKIFWEKLQGLENKQRSFLGDRMHIDLMRIDTLHLTYPGWERDKKHAEYAHHEGNDRRFERLRQKMEKKQMVHDGDRSHPRLVALDSLTLAYPGWQKDIGELEKMHFDFEGKMFWDKLVALKSKDQSFRGDRSHLNLQKLDSLSVNYPGWKKDMKRAEDAHYNGENWRFERLFEQMEKNQIENDKILYIQEMENTGETSEEQDDVVQKSCQVSSQNKPIMAKSQSLRQLQIARQASFRRKAIPSSSNIKVTNVSTGPGMMKKLGKSASLGNVIKMSNSRGTGNLEEFKKSAIRAPTSCRTVFQEVGKSASFGNVMKMRRSRDSSTLKEFREYTAIEKSKKMRSKIEGNSASPVMLKQVGKSASCGNMMNRSISRNPSTSKMNLIKVSKAPSPEISKTMKRSASYGNMIKLSDPRSAGNLKKVKSSGNLRRRNGVSSSENLRKMSKGCGTGEIRKETDSQT